jgi:hypothetical protein
LQVRTATSDLTLHYEGGDNSISNSYASGSCNDLVTDQFSAGHAIPLSSAQSAGNSLAYYHMVCDIPDLSETSFPYRGGTKIPICKKPPRRPNYHSQQNQDRNGN